MKLPANRKILGTGQSMIAVLVVVATAWLCPVSASAAGASVWQAVDGDWSGSFTNAAHWKNGIVPDNVPSGESVTAYFAQYDGAFTGTVYYPEGVWTNAAGFRLNYAQGVDLTLDGRNTQLVKNQGPYGQYPIRFSLNNTWFAAPSSYSGSSDTNYIWGVASNFLVRTGCSSELLSIDVKQGFYDYSKIAWAVFGNTKSALSASSGEARLWPGVSFRAKKFELANKTFATNSLAVNGATVAIDAGGGGNVVDTLLISNAGGANVARLVATNGASVSVGGKIRLYCKL